MSSIILSRASIIPGTKPSSIIPRPLDKNPDARSLLNSQACQLSGDVGQNCRLSFRRRWPKTVPHVTACFCPREAENVYHRRFPRLSFQRKRLSFRPVPSNIPSRPSIIGEKVR
jgi:hypothetical protein